MPSFTSPRFFGTALLLGLAACSGAEDFASPDSLAKEEAVGASAEALTRTGPIIRGPIRLWPVACGDTPVATTPVDYRPGTRPWSEPAANVSLVEVASSGGYHDIVGVYLSRTDTNHRILGRVHVRQEDFECFVGTYGSWYGWARPVDLWALLTSGVDLAHAMTDSGSTQNPKTCVSRVLPTPPPSDSDAQRYPDSCVPGGLVSVGLYDALASSKTTLPCWCPAPPLVRVDFDRYYPLPALP